MPVGKSFFDQYSVICVLGSVVGCVVVPLITQSVESLILSAILISITAKTLSSKIVSSDSREERRRPRDKDPLVEKKVKKKKLLATQPQPPLQVVLNPDQLEDEYRKHEEERALEKERRLEEKREKKARKREERLKRKEDERKEKEEKEQTRKEKDDFRACKKSESRAMSPPPLDQPAVHKPTHHERHSSTSSTTTIPIQSLQRLAATPPSTRTIDVATRYATQAYREIAERVREGRQPRLKQNQQCHVTSILQHHKESVQESPRQTEPSVAIPVEPFVAQVGLGSQAVLDCNQGAVGKPPDIAQPPAPSYNSDIWASTSSGYYTLFSTSGHTLFGNTTILSPSWDRVEDWPNV
ncbi:hypothetical protein EMCRGX_G012478 [Ephydatia muelleri]